MWMPVERSCARDILRLLLDFMVSRTSPEEAGKALKKLIAAVYPGCAVFLLSPEGPAEKQVLAADYYIPAKWLQDMIDIYGHTALIEPENMPAEGEKIFSAPFIWISLILSGSAGCGLVAVPGEPGIIPDRDSISTARELKALIEFVMAGSPSAAPGRDVLTEEALALRENASEKEGLVKDLDRAVRDPLNTIIGYSMLLLDGSVAGPLSGAQEGFIQDILDGGYLVLKDIEQFREKFLPGGDNP